MNTTIFFIFIFTAYTNGKKVPARTGVTMFITMVNSIKEFVYLVPIPNHTARANMVLWLLRLLWIAIRFNIKCQFEHFCFVFDIFRVISKYHKIEFLLITSYCHSMIDMINCWTFLKKLSTLTQQYCQRINIIYHYMVAIIYGGPMRNGNKVLETPKFNYSRHNPHTFLWSWRAH